MPAPLAWFAEHQPFTPIIETMRGLLFGTPIGSSGIVAVAWCLLFTADRLPLVAAAVRAHAVAQRCDESRRPDRS